MAGVVSDRWVVLLRGLNVGRANRVAMADLRDALAVAGFPGARTYLQSANAVVDASTAMPPDDAATRIAEAVAARTGSHVVVRVLEAAALQHAIDNDPFPTAEERPTSLHLFFLSGSPSDDGLRRLAEVAAPTEAFASRGELLYLHAPDGIGRSKLAASVERFLGVTATARNWRTVTRLSALATDDAGPHRDHANGAVNRAR